MITIDLVMTATQEAFAPGGGLVSRAETIRTCAALVCFLRGAEALPPRSLAEWRESIERLRIHVGAM